MNKMTNQYKTAALVIDMQPVFLDAYLPRGMSKKFWGGLDGSEPKIEILPERARLLISYQQEILTECLKANIPLGVIEMLYHGNTIKELGQIWEKSPNRFYVTKEDESGFCGTSLEEELRNRAIENLILMGIKKNVCVIRTAQEGIERRFKIFTSPLLIDAPDSNGGFYSPIEEWYQKNSVYVRDHKRILERLNEYNLSQ